jgi:insulysin
LTWFLEYTEKEYRSKPLSYLAHLFGHEGPYSLLSYLISEGLALELYGYNDHFLYGGDTFNVDITLT